MINTVYGCILNPDKGFKLLMNKFIAKLFGYKLYIVMNPNEPYGRAFGNKKKAYDLAWVWSDLFNKSVTVVEQFYW